MPYPGKALPTYGGLLKTLAWYSKDGRDWGKPTPTGEDNFPLNPIVWHKGTAFSCAEGSICGSAQTIHIMASNDARTFERRYKETLSGLMPYEAELLFEENTAYCLVTGYSTAGATGVLGAARPPYQSWQWKELNQRIRLARFLRLPNQRVIATVGLYDVRERTSLCEFDAAAGKLTELLDLPTGGAAVGTGLVWHDGHVWVSYPVAEGEKHSLHLAKVKLR